MGQFTFFALLRVASVVAAFAIWVTPRIEAILAESRKRTAETKAFLERYGRGEQEVAALSLGAAREQAEELLSDPQTFRCIPAATPLDERFDLLAPELHAFFSRFESVEAVDEEAILSRALFAPFEWEDDEGYSEPSGRFWQIGRIHGHGVTLVKPLQEGIHDTDGYYVEANLKEPDYPSVYHLLLMAAWEV